MRRSRVLAAFVPILLTWLLPGAVMAGPNADGAIIVHTDDAYEFDDAPCDYTMPETCEDANTQINTVLPSPGNCIWFLAAFAPTASPDVATIYFGVNFDDANLKIGSTAKGPCGEGTEIPDTGWPSNTAGCTWAFNTPQTATLFPFYWFLVRPKVTGGPPTGAYWCSADNPTGGYAAFIAPTLDTDLITRFGCVRWYEAGENECPGGMDGPDGPDGPEGGRDAPQGDEGEESGGDGSGLAGRGILYPSTDQDPFEKIDIYADRTAQYRNQDHQSAYGYPSWLTDPNALMIRYRGITPGDTLAAAHSFANDFTFIDSRATDQGYVEYAVDPPRFASSVDLLATGYYLFNDVNTFDDYGHPILMVTTTHEGGGSYVDTLKSGIDMRNYRGGTVAACADAILESRLPESPLSGEVWSGVWGTPPATWYYDVHELVIPPPLRNKRITSIRLDSIYEWAHCYGSVNLYAGTRVNGISLDPKFHIVTASGDSVVAQRQNDSTWGSHPYGGILVDGDVIGAWRDISALGCYLTCFSMLSNFYETSCDPDMLNSWAIAHGGYAPTIRGTVLDVSGQGVGDTISIASAVDKPFRQGDGVVIERPSGAQRPLAWAEFIPPYDGAERRAVIVERYSSSILIREDDVARSYTLLDPNVASGFGASRRYRIEPLGAGSETIERTEDAMREGYPVLVNTRLERGRFQHWVLGDGMKAHFDPGEGNHRGTYRIHDPYWGADELLYWRFANQYGRAVLTEPVSQFVEQGESRVTVAMEGPAVLRLSDPNARTVWWDGSAYQTDIPGCYAVDDYAVGEPADSIPEFDVDFITIPSPTDGNYVVEVSATDAGEVALTIGGYDVEGGYSYDTRLHYVESEEVTVYLVTYSSTPDSVVHVEEIDPAGVGDSVPDGRVVSWHLAPNPTTRGAGVVFNLPSPARVQLGVFDVSGRRIARLFDGAMSSGRQRIGWDGLDTDGSRVAAGIYFVELRTDGHAAVKKIICLK